MISGVINDLGLSRYLIWIFIVLLFIVLGMLIRWAGRRRCLFWELI